MPADKDDAGWIPGPGVGEPVDRMEIQDLAVLRTVGHPLRSRIMRRLKSPRTVAQLAQDLGVPVTRLYHHVNQLAELGLIRVVATRRVAAATERRYQVAAQRMDLAPHLVASSEPAEIAEALGSLFDIVKLDLQREIETGDFLRPDGDGVLSLGQFALTSERRSQLAERLTDLIAEFESDAEEGDPGARRVSLFIAAVPHSD